MQSFNSTPRFIYKTFRFSSSLLLAATLAMLAGCGGDAVTTGTTGTASISISLIDTVTGATTSSTPATVTATVLDANGAPVPNTVVTFATDPTTATLTPSTGTALTNAAGITTISLNAANSTAGGASTITASAQVGTSPVTSSIGFAVNAAAPVSATITAPTFGTSLLSAYGTTSVIANVTPTTTPVTVTFTSICATANPPKATLSTSVTTVAGVATGSYLDNGCGTTDTITASISGTSAFASSPLNVTPPAIGSLQYVSATPETISLKGTGGVSTSQVVFKVLDSGGNPLSGKTVTFGLSTNVGGITFTPDVPAPTATSDSSGLVSISVNGGTVSTPVRVSATTCASTTSPCPASSMLATQSNELTVTTGIPDQDSFSLAAEPLNTEGWNTDGNESTLTVRLSDHFNNPVPDGTAVNFTTEGGSVVASCTTTGGSCTSTFTTQQPHPTNGRATVLAYAVGEESFTDLNGNGVADLSPNEMLDANGMPTDMPEAYVDWNEDGVRNNNEPPIDFNLNGAYDAADGLFNGVLCSSLSSAGTCSATKTIHVRRSIVITMSSSTPAPIALFDNSAPPAAATIISLPSCNNPNATLTPPVTATTASGPVTTYYVRIVDKNGNAMPTGTTIGFATSNGDLRSPGSYTVQNTTGCSSAFAGCPAGVGSPAFEYYPVKMQSDAAYSTACDNTKASGLLNVTVTSPGGVITTATFTIND